jgi:hypothetical protein
MKKSVLFSVFLLFLVVAINFIASASDSSNSTITVEDLETEEEKVDLAYTCLEDMIEEKECNDLSLTEQIFAVSATGKCYSDLVDDSHDEECWPKSDCESKETAQAMIAVDRTGSSIEDIQGWLLTQNISEDSLQWFLEIIGGEDEEISCEIKYDGNSYTVDLNKDKTLSSGAGSCLSIDYNNYWLMISPSCYDYDFEVTCDKSFQTTLMYKKSDSSVLYISENIDSRPAEGTTTEKVNSQCFTKDGECDYDSTLWAVYALVLTSSYDVSPFWPYLQTMAEDNEELLPEGILSYISGSSEFKSQLFEKQEGDGYWYEKDKYYDTAFALMPFSGQDSSQKTKAIDWLLTSGVQDKDGCWQGSISSTAFILYSIWPRAVSISDGSSTTKPDCELNGYFCLPTTSCTSAGGITMSSYSCSASSEKCCSQDLVLKTCSELSGTLCLSSQQCVGTEEDSSDSSSQVCCIGICKDIVTETSECEENNGDCYSKNLGCASDETQESYSCGDSTKVCCVKSTETPSTSINTNWIWIVAVLFF